MTEIYFVRHPETPQNTDRSIVGGRSNNAPITERGVEQARRFAKVFSTQYPRPDGYYSSPAVRAKALLDIYNETTSQQNSYVIDPDLQEMSQGLSEGLPRAEVYTPEVLEAIAKQQHDFALPGGESLNDTSARMYSWMNRAHKQYPNGVLLVATHGQAIRATVGGLLKWSHFKTTIGSAYQTDNVSLTHITVHGHEMTVNFWGKDIIEPVENNSPKVY
jgi:probable phosphoglycerate mutase